MGDYGDGLASECTERIAVLLDALLEGLELMIVRPTAELILVRTNIRKLAEALSKDLYVKSSTGTQIAQKIHERLEILGKSHTPSTEWTLSLPDRTTVYSGSGGHTPPFGLKIAVRYKNPEFGGNWYNCSNCGN